MQVGWAYVGSVHGPVSASTVSHCRRWFAVRGTKEPPFAARYQIPCSRMSTARNGKRRGPSGNGGLRQSSIMPAQDVRLGHRSSLERRRAEALNDSCLQIPFDLMRTESRRQIFHVVRRPGLNRWQVRHGRRATR